MKNNIKKYRQMNNMTQQDLADAVKVRRETIVFLEKNKYNPSLKLALLISKTLKVSIHDLFEL